MPTKFNKIKAGYQKFRAKYSEQETRLMQDLAEDGQSPEVMLVACCDSRVDPALLLQCHPGDLFVVRNIANIVPPYVCDESHHGTSAALEFGICYLNVSNLIIMGHSQCGGIDAFLNEDQLDQDDFISRWASMIDVKKHKGLTNEACAKSALQASYKNCLSFPWINDRLERGELKIHLWFFDISTATIQSYNFSKQIFEQL